MKCERCQKNYDFLLDYCAICLRNLCNKCMEEGHCNNKPALSGMEADYGEEDEDTSDEIRSKTNS